MPKPTLPLKAWSARGFPELDNFEYQLFHFQWGPDEGQVQSRAETWWCGKYPGVRGLSRSPEGRLCLGWRGSERLWQAPHRSARSTDPRVLAESSAAAPFPSGPRPVPQPLSPHPHRQLGETADRWVAGGMAGGWWRCARLRTRAGPYGAGPPPSAPSRARAGGRGAAAGDASPGGRRA